MAAEVLSYSLKSNYLTYLRHFYHSLKLKIEDYPELGIKFSVKRTTDN